MPVELSSPASSAASLPALVSLDTHTPVSSKRGSVMSWVSACRPTLPVPICATLMAMASSSQVRDGQVEVWNRESAVDLEHLAGQETCGRRREIDGGSGDVGRVAESPHGRCLFHRLAQFVVGGDDVEC